MNEIEDFFRRFSRLAIVSIEHDELHGRLHPFFNLLIKMGALKGSGQIQNILCDCGEIELIVYSSDAIPKGKVAYYQCSNNGSGRTWITKDQCTRWEFNVEPFLQYLNREWRLSGKVEQLQAGVWLLGRRDGVAIVLAKKGVDDSIKKKYQKMLVVVPRTEEVKSADTIALGQYISFGKPKEGIKIDSIDDAVSMVRGEIVHAKDEIMLDDDSDMRFILSSRMIHYVSPDGTKSEVKVVRAAAELLSFLYHQSRSNSRQKFFSDEFIREKSPYFKGSKHKTLSNAKSVLNKLHDKNLGITKLLLVGTNGVRLNDDLSCIKKLSPKPSPK